MRTSLQRVLHHVQSRLDEDLSLATLAQLAGLSASRFHRVFRGELDETPKRYVQRLRLDRAALRLGLHDDTILRIALDCGFANHETFSRAFRRRFDTTPRDFRARRRPARDTARDPRAETAGETTEYTLSKTRIRRLAPADLATIRHVGPYETTPDTLWSELTAWRADRGEAGAPVLLGIAHDAPGITPPDRLRFDAGVQVPAPFESDEHVVHRTLPCGWHAVTSHTGPYATLPGAYAAIVSRLLNCRDVRLLGVPSIEVYLATRVTADATIAHTEIALPVTPTPSARPTWHERTLA